MYWTLYLKQSIVTTSWNGAVPPRVCRGRMDKTEKRKPLVGFVG